MPRYPGLSSRGLRELLQQNFHLLVFLQRVCLYIDLLELRREVVVFVSSSEILEVFFQFGVTFLGIVFQFGVNFLGIFESTLQGLRLCLSFICFFDLFVQLCFPFVDLLCQLCFFSRGSALFALLAPMMKSSTSR